MAGKTRPDVGQVLLDPDHRSNAVTSSIDDRMPVILDRGDYGLWVDPAMTNVEAVSKMLKPHDARMMYVSSQ